MSLAGSGVVILALIAGILLEVAQSRELRMFVCSKIGAFCGNEILAQKKPATVEVVEPAAPATPSQ